MPCMSPTTLLSFASVVAVAFSTHADCEENVCDQKSEVVDRTCRSATMMQTKSLSDVSTKHFSDEEERADESATQFTEKERARQNSLKRSTENIECAYMSMLSTNCGVADASDVMEDALAHEVVRVVRLKKPSYAASSSAPTLEEFTTTLWSTYAEATCSMCGICAADFAAVLASYRAQLTETPGLFQKDDNLTSSGSGNGIASKPRVVALEEGRIGLSDGAMASLKRDLHALEVLGLTKSQVVQLVAELAVDEEEAAGASIGRAQPQMTAVLDLPIQLMLALGENKRTVAAISLQALTDLLTDVEYSRQQCQVGKMSLLQFAQKLSAEFLRMHCGETIDCATTFAKIVAGSANVETATENPGLLQSISSGAKAVSFSVLEGAVGMAVKFMGAQRFDSADLENRAASSIFEIDVTADQHVHLELVRKAIKGLIRESDPAHLVRVSADLLRDVSAAA